MVIRAPFATLQKINIGRWLLYETLTGNVIKAVNPILHTGRAYGNIIWEVDPPIAIATFLQRFPESLEVIEIMADVNTLPQSSQPNQAQFSVTEVLVALATTPIQASSIVVPDGISVSIQAAPDNGAAKIFVANSSVNALDATKRVELTKGQSMTLDITNTNLIWIGASANNKRALITVEA